MIVIALTAEVRPLSGVADPFSGFLVGGDALFQGGIVQPARLGEQAVEGGGLRSVGPQAVLVGPDHSAASLLCLNGFPDSIFGNVSDAAHIIRSAPKYSCPGSQMRKLPAKNPGSVPLEWVRKLLWRPGWIGSHKQVDVIGHDLQSLNVHFQLACFLSEQGFQTHSHIPHKNLAPVFRTPNEMRLERTQIASVRYVSSTRHRTIVLQIYRNDIFRPQSGSGSRRFQIPLSPVDDSPLWRFLWNPLGQGMAIDPGLVDFYLANTKGCSRKK